MFCEKKKREHITLDEGGHTHCRKDIPPGSRRTHPGVNANVSDQIGRLFEFFRTMGALVPTDIALLPDGVPPENADSRIRHRKSR